MAQEKKPSIMTKKLSELTEEDKAAIRKPLGIPGLPYPSVDLVEQADGRIVYKLGIIQDKSNPIIVHSDLSPKAVNGLFYRNMPIPAMIPMLQEMLERSAPERRDRVVAMLGEAAYGKSKLFKDFASVMHPDGAIVVDCGGMNMHELIFRTVIDYGKGVKDLFDQRVKAGRISENTLVTLETAFPGSVVRTANKLSPDAQAAMDTVGLSGEPGDSIHINWDAIGLRKQTDDGTGKKVSIEDRGDAARRARDLLTFLFEKEGITVQSNAFGIKTVPGELYESWVTGRPIFLDELTKAIPESLDVFQTVTQVFNGEEKFARVYNPMSESGELDNDSPRYLDFNAGDMRASWFMGVAGNESSDGVTTHDLSKSLKTRIHVMRVGEATEIDWAHRISQIWMGLPLTTMYTLFETIARAKPEAFGKFLADLRQLDLTAEQVNAIPPHQLEFLKDYPNKVQAANQIASFWHTQEQLAKEDSPLLRQDAYKNLVDELGEGNQNIDVSFRKIIATYNKAIHSTPEVRDAKEAVLELDLAKVFNDLDLSAIGQAAPGWHRFGDNLARAIRMDIANATVGMPLTRAALFKVAKENGIVLSSFKEALPSDDVKSIAELLRYDEHAEAGGSDELLALRGVVMAAIRSQWKNLRQSDDTVIPVASLARVVKSLDEQKETSGRAYIVPNDDLDNLAGAPLVAGQAIPVYDLPQPEASDEYELVDYRSILASLAAPHYGDRNRERVWPAGFTVRLDDPPDPNDKENMEAYNIGEGKGKWGFNMTILTGANEKGDPVYMWVIEDKTHLQKTNTEWRRYMVVGPEPVSPDLQATLAKGGITYLVKSDPATVTEVNEFLTEGARVRGEDGQMHVNDTREVIESLVKAFSVQCELAGALPGDNSDEQIIPEEATLGKMIHEAVALPAVFTSIVKPKAKAPAPGAK